MYLQSKAVNLHLDIEMKFIFLNILVLYDTTQCKTAKQ